MGTQTDDELDAVRMQGADVLREIKRYRRLTDAELGLRVGLSRQTTWTYSKGLTRLEIGIIVRFADALDVAPEVFFMTPDEALAWTIEHRPNGPARRPERTEVQEVASSSTKW
ncbi:MAG: hypothetical protein QOK39_2678 [Acidimicrobiaceae bacterium]|jgi:transcriptional regulator with XRE-family HTH domain|nr:hypothetical protein [Acidimicrobiaceae bacterium]